MSAQRWLQIAGDPAMRDAMLQALRVRTEFDEQMDEVLAHIDILMRGHGVFHAKIHFSTGQVTLWLVSDPLRYRVHLKEDFLNSTILQVYPRMPYPEVAIVPESGVSLALGEFMRLRALDDKFYLRSGSLNVVNGMIGLTFSCGGTHYLPYADFPAWTKEIQA